MADTLLEAAIVVIFAASGTLLAGLAFVVYRYRDARGTKEFSVTLSLASLWSFSAAAKLVVPTAIEHVFVSIELFYGLLFEVTLLVFAAAYTGRSFHERRWFTTAVVGTFGLCLALLATNPVHSLLWEDIVHSTSVFPHLVHQGKGPGYWAVVALSYGIMAVSLYYLVDLHVRSRYNTQSVLLVVVGSILAVSANVVSLVDALAIQGLDYTPFGLVIFGLATTTAIRQDLFAIIPIARDTAVEYSSEGMIICDSERTIRDYNATAAALFPSLETHHGEPISEVVPQTVVRFDPVETHHGEATVTVAEERRHVTVRATPIREGAHHLGWSVVCNDVTDQKRRERHLSLVARVLRHNMSNQITIIQGKAELLRDAVDGAETEHVESITSSGRRIMTTSAKLRTIQEIVTDDRGPVPMDLGQFVESVVRDARIDHPQASIEYDALDVWVRATTGLGAAIENLIENAIIHAETEEPWVGIEVTTRDDGVMIAVSDDGPGIPPSEQRILDQGETPLQHSSGVGLWLVYRFVERCGRDLAFERRPDGGSRVSFVLERADAPE